MKSIFFLTLLVFCSCQDFNQEFDYQFCSAELEDPSMNYATIHGLKPGLGPVEIGKGTLSGYVVSSDEQGAFYKELVIQSELEADEAGLSIWVEDSGIFSQFKFGQKVLIKTDDLAFGRVYGQLMIGVLDRGVLRGIRPQEYSEVFTFSCDAFAIQPIMIDQGLPDFDNVWVKMRTAWISPMEEYIGFEGVVNRYLELYSSENCEFPEFRVFLFSSGYSEIRKTNIQTPNFELSGLYKKEGEKDLVIPIFKADFNWSSEGCSKIRPTVELVDFLSGSDSNGQWVASKEELIVELFVVSTNESHNAGDALVFQDKLGRVGLKILTELDDFEFTLGQKVFLKLNGLWLEEVNGSWTISAFGKSKPRSLSSDELNSCLFLTTEIENLRPKEIEDLNFKESNIYVKLKDYQLSELEVGLSFSAYLDALSQRTFINCDNGDKIVLSTASSADFSNKIVPEDQVSLLGYFDQNVFKLNSYQDLIIEGGRLECEVASNQKLFISEVWDPKENTYARFIELINLGEFDINLNGYRILRYVNGSVSPAGSGLALDGLTITSGEAIILANNNFEDLFRIEADLLSNYILGNGDDVYVLVDEMGRAVDQFGQIGLDGTGLEWEYLDSGFERLVFDKAVEFDVQNWAKLMNITNASPGWIRNVNKLKKSQ